MVRNAGSDLRGAQLLLILGGILLLLAGCATLPLEEMRPQQVESVRSDLAVTLVTTSGRQKVRAYLLYRQPDQLHVAILSPFGSPLLELFGSGDSVVCKLPSDGVACVGSLKDLPSGSFIGGWRGIAWALDLAGGETGDIVQRDSHGLLLQKERPGGERIRYEEYRPIDGIPFPSRITYDDGRQNQVTLTFSDTEVNVELADELLTPDLTDLRLIPLAACLPPSP